VKLTSKDEFKSRSICVDIKWSAEGVNITPNMVCDFCGENLEVSFTQKKIHYILCESCRLNFNNKVLMGRDVMKQSLGIAMFEKGDINP
jgi:hypothetical protein